MTLRAGNAYYQIGQYQAAITAYRQVDFKSPLYKYALANIGRALWKATDLAPCSDKPLLEILSVASLFDAVWYVGRHPEVAEEGIDPLQHYLIWGVVLGYQPHPLFDPAYYREENPDVAASGVEPLTHFLEIGGFEGRQPHPLFDTRWYLHNNPDVVTAHVNPLTHYLCWGAVEGRDPSPNFSSKWYARVYLSGNPINPLVHYVLEGCQQGLRSRPPHLDPAFWQADWSLVPLSLVTKPQRILVIDWKPPTPDRDSGSYRMRMILDILVDAGRTVDFIGDRSAEEPHYHEALMVQGIRVLVSHETALDHLMSHGREYRQIWIARPEIMVRYLPLVRAFAGQAQVFYDTVDLHWMRLQRSVPFAEDPVATQAEAKTYYQIEIANARSAEMTIAITEDERQALLTEDTGLKVAVVPNIHEVHTRGLPFAARRDLLFIGGFEHRPNVDAIEYFVQKIWPLTRCLLPGVVFHILGSAMPETIRKLAGPQIQPVGYVADVTPWFTQARVFVAPLRYGAGMKGKVGQSLAYGTPIVTTTIGAEGMRLAHEQDVMIADEPAKFAAAIRRLYMDEACWQRLAVNGQERIRQAFSKESVAEILLPLFA